VAFDAQDDRATARGDATRAGATRTKAELAYEAHYKRVREAQMLKEMASKSHKDKVREFNEKLSKLSEHHDIPKVGPG
jgi:protein FAM32A